MRDITQRPRPSALRRDLDALRRHAWLPVAAVAVAVAAALAAASLRPASGDARFREHVAVEALPPLFGPPVLPSPFDYARLATSDAVVARVAREAGVPTDQLRPRLHAEARFNSTQIDFRVSGAGALAVARAWRQAFADAAAAQTPDIERLLVQDYARQLDEARAMLEQRAADAQASPDDPVRQQQLKAAEDNFETASRLSQSYDVVARTIRAQSLAVVAPHTRGAGLASTAGLVGAAVAVALVAGVTGALALDYAARRRAVGEPAAEAPAAFRRRGDRPATTTLPPAR